MRNIYKNTKHVPKHVLICVCPALRGDTVALLPEPFTFSGALELGVLTTHPGENGTITINLAVAEDCLQQRMIKYDKSGDSHYDVASALIKSIRGSDPDAALHYLARMLAGGEDVKA